MIYAAQSLLREQTKEKLCGWQSTQNIKRGSMFKPIPQHLPFVQLLHVSGCHWITVSNYRVHDKGMFLDCIRIYDSASPTGVTMQLKKAICSFFRCTSDILNFEIMNVMKQQNLYDCGIYALAFATESANDKEPTLCHWDSQKMRKQLEICFERGVMMRFPTIVVPGRKPQLGASVCKICTEKIYCTCRQPNKRSRAMLQYDVSQMVTQGLCWPGYRHILQ